MLLRPTITWIGSPNFGIPRGTRGRNGYKPIAIVYHIMEGTLSGTASWFKNPDSRVSAHFGIGKSGATHQYVNEEDTAWANGGVKQPSWELLIEGVNPNLYTLSIEHEGYSGEPFTEEMYNSTLALTKYLVGKWEIPLEYNRLIGHDLITINKARCPGPSFPWSRLYTDLGIPSEGPFHDVPPSHWAVEAVQFVKDNGLMVGYPDGEFKGDNAVTRYELAQIVMRIIKQGS
jgi:N-acetyl-anhydromuramyl-L-alanine amidase AmpD